MLTFKEKTPSFGYVLRKWNVVGYRATALAYMQRENLNSVEHRNGRIYSRKAIEDSIIKS